MILNLILLALLAASMGYNILLLRAIRVLNTLVLSLFEVTKASHELLVFIVTASTASRPTVILHAVGEESAEMYRARLNNLAFALQDLGQKPRVPVCEESETKEVQ